MPELLCDGKPPHIATVFRWITTGVKGVKLRAWRIGSKITTSRAAVREFLERVNAGQTADPARPTGAEASRAHRAAASRLAKAGI
ncbi:MAG TPA: DUF1580 domain-containing protein [Tepidisphaeraceae bacterium]|nr:DUF1580 domain-containing protein [Tepidisphaeraceae bacterium]